MQNIFDIAANIFTGPGFRIISTDDQPDADVIAFKKRYPDRAKSPGNQTEILGGYAVTTETKTETKKAKPATRATTPGTVQLPIWPEISTAS